VKPFAGAEMPLSDECGPVICCSEVIGEGVFPGSEAEEFRTCLVAGAPFVEVRLVAETPWVTPGHDPGTGRGADRTGHVGLGTEDAFLCQSGQVGRLEVLGARDLQVAVAHVIRQDDKEVGLGGGRLRQAREKCQNAKQNRFHEKASQLGAWWSL
jgi:hypothetical protein